MLKFSLLALLAATAACTESAADTTSANSANSAATATATAAATAKPEAPAAPTGVVGKPAPDFTLNDLDGKAVSLKDYAGKTVVLEWFNPQCPYVKAAHGKGSLVSMAKEQSAKGIVWLAINSGADGKQGHDPAVNKEAVAAWKLEHPVLRDVDGSVGKAYGATNTPHMFVIDDKGVVVYGGAIDNSPDGEGASPTGGTLVNHVAVALDELAAKKPVSLASTKAYGCGVKY